MKEDELYRALIVALETEYQWTETWNDEEYDYRFSAAYRGNMEKIAGKANFQYVSVGRRRLRKAFVAVLIALMAFAFAGCAVAIHQAIIIWNETKNQREGTLDVDFDIAYSEEQIEDVGFISPKTPEGHEITWEDRRENYRIIVYENGKEEITYVQEKRFDTMRLSIDEENNDLAETEINGVKGQWGYEDELNLGTFLWSDGTYLYSVSGNCDMDMLKKIVADIGNQRSDAARQ
ncbi:MAG: DUF4367 domain-containing protein [Emergencia sp.]